MDHTRSCTRSSVSRAYGYPWPWRVEDILRAEFNRMNGDVHALANAFECHPKTVDAWIRKFGIRDESIAD